MSGAVRFERYGDQYAVRSAYDPVVVSLIKTVPARARSWNPTFKVWLVDRFYGEQLARDMAALGYIVTGLEPPRSRCDDDPAGWARALFRRVGPTRAPTAYKLLSRLCHPDHGGDHQLQVELNQAFGELSTERKTA